MQLGTVTRLFDEEIIIASDQQLRTGIDVAK